MAIRKKGKEKMKQTSRNLIKMLVESAVMIVLATVLSTLKLVDMPYGGSVTFASMIPVAVIESLSYTTW